MTMDTTFYFSSFLRLHYVLIIYQGLPELCIKSKSLFYSRWNPNRRRLNYCCTWWGRATEDATRAAANSHG